MGNCHRYTTARTLVHASVSEMSACIPMWLIPSWQPSMSPFLTGHGVRRVRCMFQPKHPQCVILYTVCVVQLPCSCCCLTNSALQSRPLHSCCQHSHGLIVMFFVCRDEPGPWQQTFPDKLQQAALTKLYTAYAMTWKGSDLDRLVSRCSALQEVSLRCSPGL